MSSPSQQQQQHDDTLPPSYSEQQVERLFQQHITERGPKQLFMRFLRQRFNHEMLLFLDDVRAFNKIPPSLKKEKFDRAQLLTSRYIENDGQLELNLRHDIKRSMLQQLDQYRAQWREVERKDAVEQRKVLLEQLEGLETLLNDVQERVVFQLRDECFGDFLLSDLYANRRSYLEDFRRPSKTLEQIKAERAAEKRGKHSTTSSNGGGGSDAGSPRWSIRRFFDALAKRKYRRSGTTVNDTHHHGSGSGNGSMSRSASVLVADNGDDGRSGIGSGNGDSNASPPIERGSGGIRRHQTVVMDTQPVPISASVKRRKSFFGDLLSIRMPSSSGRGIGAADEDANMISTSASQSPLSSLSSTPKSLRHSGSNSTTVGSWSLLSSSASTATRSARSSSSSYSNRSSFSNSEREESTSGSRSTATTPTTPVAVFIRNREQKLAALENLKHKTGSGK